MLLDLIWGAPLMEWDVTPSMYWEIRLLRGWEYVS